MAYAAPTPTPTSSPTRATATPRATATATAEATVTPAATATPTEGATPAAAATVTPTPTPTPVHPVDARYATLGGASGFLGAPKHDLICGLVGGGCFRAFQGGSIYWTAATGAHVTKGLIFEKWGSLRWETGKLGYPTTDEMCTTTGCVQTFTGGQITFSPKSGTYAVLAPLVSAYEGSVSGPLGYARGDAICGIVRGGCFQDFAGGSIYASPDSGAHWIRGAVKEKWGSLGWEAGFLGYPTSNEECWISNGCFQRFQGGLIYWSLPSGAHFVRGAIFDEWGRNGWEGGSLGFPTSDEQCFIRNGCFQDFQGGHIYWSQASGAHFIRGAIFDHWGRNGWEAGHLGYPTSGEFCGLRAGGCGQHFQNGSIYWSPKSGAHFVKGSIKAKWAEYGWENEYGYPLSDEICGMKNGGCRQVFEGDDMIYFSPATGAHPVFKEFMGAWGQHGWESGRLGYPVADPYYHDYPDGHRAWILEFGPAYMYFFEADPADVRIDWK
ncbi:hypothetical protein GCM10028815_22490 [Mariniluteicoccus flavus]